MRLPYVQNVSNKQLQQIVAFGGVRYGRGGNDGEFSETENLSSRQYPTLSQRGGRRSINKEFSSPTALYSRGKLIVVDGTDLFYGDEVVGQVVPGEKQFATINTKVVIFPDKVFFDTEDKKLISMEAYVPIPKESVTWTDSTLERNDGGKFSAKGNGIGSQTISSTDKVSVYTGYSIDQTSGALTLTGEEKKSAAGIESGDLLKDSSNEAQFFRVVTVEPSGGNVLVWYKMFIVKEEPEIPFTDIFSINQAVEISGSSISGNNKTIVIRSVEENKLIFYENSFLDENEENTVVIQRKVPDLSAYKEQLDSLLDAILSREDFSYDYTQDPLYQQYAEIYAREGDRAMQDTLGQVAARTGGLASSYATAAANQANNYYMAQLGDKIPELQQLAYSMWMDDYNMDMQDMSLLMGLDDSAYSRWNSDRNFNYGAFRDNISDSRYQDETEYDRWWEQYQFNQNNKIYQDETEYERALRKAETLAQFGDFSGYKDLGYTDAEIQAMKNEWTRQNTVSYSSSGGGSSGRKSSGSSSSSGSKKSTSSSSSSSGTSSSSDNQPTIDLNSVIELGYGPISASYLADLESKGQIVSYVENGKIKYKKVNNSTGIKLPGLDLFS